MKILLLGCGNLGKALLETLVNNRQLSQIVVVQPSLSAKFSFEMFKTVSFYASANSIPAEFKPDMVVIAIKPQKLATVLPEYQVYCEQALVVSMAAGVPIERLSTYLSGCTQIVRVMPNMAVSVGQSVNLGYSAGLLSESVDVLFAGTGKMIWLPKEALLDILTPISGSGPAYFLMLAEILTQITVDLGLKEAQARDLVQQTFLGSALLSNENKMFEQIVQSVASKGGVTEAALNVLTPVLPSLMSKAIQAAHKRC